MRITRLSLRNFRVFPELDLELPPGVVGIYGPNGSGKSTLVEAILWALFGVARTAKDAVRRDGATEECRATVEFEHDGHLYEITRTVAGATHSVRAEASCNGIRLAAGAVAVRQYVHQVLGMSADAFRSSVFCEQKQLDAFSARRPEDRRRLVLDLLGISPLDRARDAARAQGRALLDKVEAARLVLGDLDTLAAEAGVLEEELKLAAAARAAAEVAAAAAKQTQEATEEEAAAQERRKVERDRLAAAWSEASRRCEELRRRLAAQQDELDDLDGALSRLPELDDLAGRVEPARRRLAAVEAFETARARVMRLEATLANGLGPAGAGSGLAGLEEEATRAVRAAGEAAGRTAGLEASLAAARQQRETAAIDAEAARQLDPAAPCPLCGQELGACFEAVLGQRVAAREQADDVMERLVAEVEKSRSETAEAEHRADHAQAVVAAERAEEERRAGVRAEWVEAQRRLSEAEAALGPAPAPDAALTLERELVALEAARDEALRLRDRLARADVLRAAAADERVGLAAAEVLAQRLLEEGRALHFDPGAHAAALEARRRARDALATAEGVLLEKRLAERGLAERLGERRRGLDAELARRGELTGLDDEARHHGRLGELLAEFRNSLVGEVGPALSTQTTALFRELTDGRFDRLEVDADTFELRVWSAGADHSLERHSGSETDLANLALRVAIGEQVNLLSGGHVGLLVLDEVLGSLDGEHRDRLIGALTRLGARFRQVIVVTHAVEVKEQLPHAVEVFPVAQGHSRTRLAAPHLHLLEAG